MVAPKRGRGAKAKAASTKAQAEEAAQQEEQQQVEETNESMAEDTLAEQKDNNGESEPMEQSTEESSEEKAEGSEEKKEEDKPEEKKEEKVEPGKLLIENLPAKYLFDYQDKLKELFSKHGEVNSVKRGPMIVTELTTTPTLSAIVEFKNKENLEKALAENGTIIEGNKIAVSVESWSETAVLVGVPYEASTDYVKNLFAECGEITQIHEFIKAKYKILRVTFQLKESVEKALKLDRELRINGFLVTVSKYRDEEEKTGGSNNNKNKRQSNQNNRNSTGNAQNNNANRNNNSFRGRGGGGNNAFNARSNYQGNFANGSGRGRGAFSARGGGYRGGYGGGMNNYMPQAYMSNYY